MDMPEANEVINVCTNLDLFETEKTNTKHEDCDGMSSDRSGILHCDSGDDGVFVQIVEDPNTPSQLNQDDGQSAVVINLPSSVANSCMDLQDDVFSNAVVTVSLHYLAYVPEDKSSFFSELCSGMDVKVGHDDSTKVTLEGTWSHILLLQDTMKAYLESWKQTPITGDTDESEDTLPQDSAKLAEINIKMEHMDDLQGGLRNDDSSETFTTQDNKDLHLTISQAVDLPGPSAESQTVVVHDSVSNMTYSSKNRKSRNYERIAPYKFFCNICSFKTKRESHYHKHLSRHDTSSMLYHCDTCNFTTIRLGHLRRHELTHCTNTLTCPLCPYETDDERFLARHKRLKHHGKTESDVGKPVELLSCTKCSYTTTKMHLFARHINVHVHSIGLKQQDSFNFKCEECSYKTNRKEHYIRHVNNVHQNRRPYLCDLCGKAFKRPDALKQHGITHAELDPTVAVFRCKFCNKACRSQTHLNEHSAVHSNVRAFLCEICGLSFKTRSVQRKHVLTIHKNPQAFSCNKCLRKFNTKYALRRHMKQHSWKNDETDASQQTESIEDKSLSVSEEIIVSIPAGAVAVPLYTVLPSKEKDEVSEGEAAEVLAFQLTQMPECSTADTSDAAQPSTSDEYLSNTSESNTLLFVPSSYARF